MKKKMLAFLMAVIIVVGIFPVTAMAGEGKVAKIGETEYETLQAAVNAANDGDTIIMVADVADGIGVKIENSKFNNKGLTIDFDNHTYTATGSAVGSNGTQNQMFHFVKDNKITMMNGTLQVKGENKGLFRFVIQNYADLTLDGMTLDGTNLDWDSTHTGKSPYTLSNNCGTTLIKDSTIIAASDGYAFDSYYWPAGGYTAPKVTIENSTISGTIEVEAESGKTVQDDQLTVKSGSFTDLATAIKYANNDATIELLKDVTLTSPMDINAQGKSIVLDLGTHTLTGRTNLKAGTLTIKNGTVAGGEAQALNVYGSNTETAEYSVLNIEADVNVTANQFAVCLFGNTATTNGYGAVANIKGTIHTTGTGAEGAVFVSGNLGVNVENATSSNIINITGKITSNADAALALNGLAVVNVEAGAELEGNTAVTVKRGTLNVKGGKIKSTGNSVDPISANYNGTEMTGAAISVSSSYSSNGPLAVNISGGEILADKGVAVLKYKSVKNSTPVEFTKAAGITITGGTFSDLSGIPYCAENAVYTLGNNVTLTQRVDTNFTGTIDLNGKTVSSTATCANGSVFNVVSGTVEIKNGKMVGIAGPTGLATPYENECDVITVRSGAVANLDALDISINSITGACAYAFDGSTINVKSGTYTNSATETFANDHQMLLNQADNKAQRIFVSGGTFVGANPASGDNSGNPATFLANNYFSKKIGESKWKVEPEAKVENNEIKIGGGTVTVEGIGEGTEKPTAVEAVAAINEALANTAVTTENAKDLGTAINEEIAGGTIVDSEVKVELQSVEVKKADNESATITEMVFDVVPVAIITTAEGQQKEVEIHKAAAPITFRLPVSSNIGNDIEWAAVYHEGKFMGNYAIKTDETNKYIEVSSKEFSIFGYALVDPDKAIAEVDGVPYRTLGEAVEKASGKTITVLKDTDETVIVERAMNFKLVPGTGVTKLGNIKPGDDYIRHIYGDKYYFELYEAGDTIVIGGNRNKDTKTETKEENPETGAPVMSMGALVVLAAAYVATRKH